MGKLRDLARITVGVIIIATMFPIGLLGDE
jgi:hypothetical protein